MRLTSIIILFVVILDYLNRKYVKISMVVNTILYFGLFGLVAGILLYMLSSEFLLELSISFKIFILIICLFPIIFIKFAIELTIKIIDLWINKNKIEEEGVVEKGIIQEVKSYKFRGRYSRNPDGYYLIVDFNGEKIKSVPFRYNTGGTLKLNLNITRKERFEKILGEIPQLYNIGDEIDVIVYNNRKYVKLKDFHVNKYL